jgi:cytidine deaminase
MDNDELVRLALRARERAYAPYSNFKVGACLLAAKGRVFTGCNVENASFGLTVCAERVALWKAISEGESEFVRMIVASGSERPAPPCGACRQVLWEFCPDIEVVLAGSQGFRESHRLAELFPKPFGRNFL